MTDGPEWFAPKRYGFGSGLPIAWQGWALTFGFVAVSILVSVSFGDRPLQMIALLAPVAIVFVVVCARTTRGGWHWRWGNED